MKTLVHDYRTWYWDYYAPARQLHGRVADKYLMYRYHTTMTTLDNKILTITL